MREQQGIDSSGEKSLISVITVVYNAATTLEQTIQSVISQTYDHLEYIIIDGGSTDGTLDVIRKYDSVIDFWVSEPDEGIYHAMNKGIAWASGELIGILNSDDLYFPYTVEAVVNQFESFNSPCVLYGNMIKFSSSGTEIFFEGNLTSEGFSKLEIRLNHPTCFVHRQIYDRYEAFDENFEIGADREFMFRLHNKQVPFIHVDKTLAKFRLGGTTSRYSAAKALRTSLQECRMYIRHNAPLLRAAALVGRKFMSKVGKMIMAKAIGPKRLDEMRAKRLKVKYMGNNLPAGG